MDPKMKHGRKPAASPATAGSDLNRRLSALVMLLESKGVLHAGEFEDAVMSLKVQFSDHKPGGSRGSGIEERNGSEYRGPERRTELASQRGQGQERRVLGIAPFGHVSGHTVNAEDSTPVSGVQLILRRGQGDARPIQFRSTKSDKQGRFVFLNLPIARSENGESYNYDLEVRYRNQTLVANMVIRLNEGATVSHQIPLKLAPVRQV